MVRLGTSFHEAEELTTRDFARIVGWCHEELWRFLHNCGVIFLPALCPSSKPPIVCVQLSWGSCGLGGCWPDHSRKWFFEFFHWWVEHLRLRWWLRLWVDGEGTVPNPWLSKTELRELSGERFLRSNYACARNQRLRASLGMRRRSQCCAWQHGVKLWAELACCKR